MHTPSPAHRASMFCTLQNAWLLRPHTRRAVGEWGGGACPGPWETGTASGHGSSAPTRGAESASFLIAPEHGSCWLRNASARRALCWLGGRLKVLQGHQCKDPDRRLPRAGTSSGLPLWASQEAGATGVATARPVGCAFPRPVLLPVVADGLHGSGHSVCDGVPAPGLGYANEYSVILTTGVRQLWEKNAA